MEENELEELLHPNTTPLPTCTLKWSEGVSDQFSSMTNLVVMEPCFASFLDVVRPSCDVVGRMEISDHEYLSILRSGSTVFVMTPADPLLTHLVLNLLVSKHTFTKIIALSHTVQALPNDASLTKISYPASTNAKSLIGIALKDLAGELLTISRVQNIHSSVLLMQTHAVSINKLIETLSALKVDVPEPKDVKKAGRLIASQAAPLSMYI